MQFDIQNQKFKRRILLLAAAAVILLIGLGIQSLVARSSFRITNTDPALSDVSSSAAFIKLYFNREVDPESIAISDPDDAIKSYNAQGASIILTLQGGLETDEKYNVVLERATSVTGEDIKNKNISFTTKDIPLSKLSAEQQTASINGQLDKPYEPNFIDYQNFDTLIDNGVTEPQLQNIERTFYDYSVSIKKEYRQMTLNPNSVVFAPYDPEAADLLVKADFTVTLDGQAYPTHIEYDPTYDAVEVVIKNAAGQIVYNPNDHQD